MIEVSWQYVGCDMIISTTSIGSQLMFVGNTPVVNGNSVTIELAVGSYFASVECQISGEQTPVDCEIIHFAFSLFFIHIYNRFQW